MVSHLCVMPAERSHRPSWSGVTIYAGSGDPDVQQVISDPKRWCLSCYDIVHAHRCNQEAGSSSPLKSAFNYAGRFSGVWLLFGLGVGATFIYVWSDLKKMIRMGPGSLSAGLRALIFLTVTLLYIFLVVCLFWYVFSETEQVVTGEYAILHIISWSKFAFFFGVFLGLLGKSE